MFTRYLLRILGHQRWIRFGIRDRIIRAFDNVDKRPKELFSIPFFGKTYMGDLSVYIDWATYYYGAYAGEELELMRDALDGIIDPVVLDIGANVGHHSLFASTLAKEVHAFEPFPHVFSKIYEKIKINSINNIKVHELGLGDADGYFPYHIPLSNNTGTGSFINSSVTTSKSTIDLLIKVGDKYLQSHQFRKVDFIKMDIEGFEPQALKGLHNTLTSYRPIIFFEWSSNERKSKTELKLLFPEKYTIYILTADAPFFGIFSKKGYKLVEDTAPFSDGNKVAIPNEQISRFNTIKNKKKNILFLQNIGSIA